MNERQTDLARKLVEHWRWRWVEGMYDATHERRHSYTERSIPDLSDYATAAILLRMAMETTRRTAYVEGLYWYIDRREQGADVWPLQSADLGVVAAVALLSMWRESAQMLDAAAAPLE